MFITAPSEIVDNFNATEDPLVATTSEASTVITAVPVPPASEPWNVNVSPTVIVSPAVTTIEVITLSAVIVKFPATFAPSAL